MNVIFALHNRGLHVGEASRECHANLGSRFLDLEGAVLQIWPAHVEQWLHPWLISQRLGALGSGTSSGIYHQ